MQIKSTPLANQAAKQINMLYTECSVDCGTFVFFNLRMYARICPLGIEELRAGSCCTLE